MRLSAPPPRRGAPEAAWRARLERSADDRDPAGLTGQTGAGDNDRRPVGRHRCQQVVRVDGDQRELLERKREFVQSVDCTAQSRAGRWRSRTPRGHPSEERLGGSTGNEVQEGPVDEKAQLAKWRRIPTVEGEPVGADVEASRKDREEWFEARRSPPDLDNDGALEPLGRAEVDEGRLA